MTWGKLARAGGFRMSFDSLLRRYSGVVSRDDRHGDRELHRVQAAREPRPAAEELGAAPSRRTSSESRPTIRFEVGPDGE